MANPIVDLVGCLLKIPDRLENAVAAYLLALMLDTAKHSQTFASKVSGLHKSQFSRLLSQQGDLATSSVASLSKQTATLIAGSRTPLVNGAPWTIGLIYDATLHNRSSRHIQNSQRFNHGEGFVIGHQWTNIVLLLDDTVIPLPPIAFYSKNECRRRGVAYKTEHECLEEYLKDLNLADWVGEHDPAEVVVLSDSGYDNKILQKRSITKGWDFISALKVNRGAQTDHEHTIEEKKWRRIDKLFLAVKKTSPWETVRTTAGSGKKRKEFRARRLIGRLKGLKATVAMVCSEKPRNKGRKYLACSNIKVSTGVIIRAYRLRWEVELFHRFVKNRLGLQDAGVEGFDSLTSHVHWVYVAYLLLLQLSRNDKVGMESRLRMLQDEVAKLPWRQHYRATAAAANRYGGSQSIKRQCLAALQKLQAA